MYSVLAVLYTHVSPAPGPGSQKAAAGWELAHVRQALADVAPWLFWEGNLPRMGVPVPRLTASIHRNLCHGGVYVSGSSGVSSYGTQGRNKESLQVIIARPVLELRFPHSRFSYLQEGAGQITGRSPGVWQRQVRVRPMYGLKHAGMQSGSIGRQDRRKEAARKARSNFGVHPESHRLGLGNIVLHFSPCRAPTHHRD